ncbi:MAG: WG repeat-containing protein [Ferruginibacter sp.]
MTIKNLLVGFLMVFTLPVFAQDADMSMIPYRKGDLWGYATIDKNIIITPQYAEADLFYEGLASVKKGNLYGYINKAGKVVIPFKFYTAKAFRFGYYDVSGNLKPGDGSINAQKTVLFAGASLKPNGVEICIDVKGQELRRCPAINEPNTIGTPTVTTVSNYSTIQKSDLFDKIVGDYKIIAGADETYYIATRNNNYGVFNNKFEVVIPFEYSMIEKLNTGAMTYLLVEKGGMRGVLFGTGSPYLAVENSKLKHVKSADGTNYFIFTKDGKTGVRDSRYKNIVEPVYEDITYDGAGPGFTLTGNANLQGYIFSNNSILEPKYTSLKALKGGQYVLVKTMLGKWGYVSNNLVEFFED